MPLEPTDALVVATVIPVVSDFVDIAFAESKLGDGWKKAPGLRPVP